MFTSDTLANHSVFITGGGSGLGLSMAERFLSLGAKVAICGRTADTLANAKLKLASAGDRLRTYPLDVRDYDAVSKVMDQLFQPDFGITTLVNNAAGNFYCASEELTPNGFRSVIDIVLQGTFNCSQCFGKRMIESKRSGSILNIVTTYTETGSSFVLPSACAKAGVAAMTTTLAFEWASHGIRVNAIAPGPIPTEGAWARLVPGGDFEELYRKRQPMGRFGSPGELANLATFMISDLGSYLNGEIVALDGGERLRGGQFNFLSELFPQEKLKGLFADIRKKTK